MASIIELICGLELIPTMNCNPSSMLTFLIRSSIAIDSNSFSDSTLNEQKTGTHVP
jgi:hypothetical protein